MAENEVAVALDIVLEEVESAIEALSQRLAEAGKGEDFAAASDLAAKGSEMKAFRDKVYALRKEWQQNLASLAAARRRKRSRRAHERLRRGLRTPEDAFRTPILLALLELGGSARMSTVLDKIAVMMKEQLSYHDRQPLPSNPRTMRWRNTAQWARQAMVDEGLLSPDSPRGLWELTSEGRVAAETAAKTA